MIKLTNFIFKIIASILVFYIFCLNVIIVLLFWDGKYMVATEIMDMLWFPKDEKN